MILWPNENKKLSVSIEKRNGAEAFNKRLVIQHNNSTRFQLHKEQYIKIIYINCGLRFEIDDTLLQQ